MRHGDTVVGGFPLWGVGTRCLLAAAACLVLLGAPHVSASPISSVHLPVAMRNCIEQPQAKVRIGYIDYASQDEYIRIDNVGTLAQDMTDWKIVSVVGSQTYYFPPGCTLNAGARVYVHSGPAASDNPPRHLRWTGRYVWSNDGDEARLYDAQGREVDRWGY